MTRVPLVIALSVATVGGLASRTRAAPAPPGEVVRVEHHDPDAPPTRGPPNAPVTIELFFVPGVHSRQAIYRNLEQLQARHPSRIRLVYRLIKSNQANLPDAALEALAQGKFFEMMAALDDSHSMLSRERILEIGKAVGLDVQQLEAAMIEGRYADSLKANDERHLRLHGLTAPDALFNGRRPHGALGTLSMSALEENYDDAYKRALELVDRGIDPRALAYVFEAEALAPTEPVVVSGVTDRSDDAADGAPIGAPVLADPPLSLAGLPSKGPANAAVPIVVLCQPASTTCYRELEFASKIQSIYPDDVRIVWAPWFDVGRLDVQSTRTPPGSELVIESLTMLADAALCAEALGDGWDWVEQMGGELARRRGRRAASTMDTIDNIAGLTQVNRRALARCEAETAGRTLSLIAAARRAGVRVGPSVIVGGRIYPGGADEKSLQALVEAELAPGVLGEVAPAR